MQHICAWQTSCARRAFNCCITPLYLRCTGFECNGISVLRVLCASTRILCALSPFHHRHRTTTTTFTSCRSTSAAACLLFVLVVLRAHPVINYARRSRRARPGVASSLCGAVSAEHVACVRVCSFVRRAPHLCRVCVCGVVVGCVHILYVEPCVLVDERCYAAQQATTADNA